MIMSAAHSGIADVFKFNRVATQNLNVLGSYFFPITNGEKKG